jgi:hypothetical protein
MAKSDLLKEAIADAKAVKETALANAKVALQEAFTPRIKEMLQNSLISELEDDDMEMAMEPEMDGEMDMEADPEMDGEMAMEPEMDGEPMDVGDIELDTDMDGEIDFTGDIMSKPGMEAEPEMEPEMDDMGDVPVDDMESDAGMGDDMGDDLGIEEIIKELEEDLESDGMNYGSEDDANEVYTEGAGDDGSSHGDDLKHESTNKSIDELIEAILAEEEEEKCEDCGKPVAEGASGGCSCTESKNETVEMQKELTEAYNTVKHLKSVINEVNLLNAKLLYTNKLFRNFDLNEGQKMKVIENFDRAGNPREAKLVFTTLAESFTRPKTGKRKVVKESRSIASKPVATTAPSKKTTQVLSEGFEQANRWKKLAGLI